MNLDVIVGTVFLLGMIDQIEGGYVLAEVTRQGARSELMELPIVLFPCVISEGDFFYARTVDGVTEIRCGEPPE